MKNDKAVEDILGFYAACIYCAVPLGLTDTARLGEDDSFAGLNEQIRSIPPISQSDLEKAMKGET